MIFEAGLEQGQERASTTTVALLIICGFLTGNGGSGGLASSLNAVAKSFPEHVVSARNLSNSSVPMLTPGSLRVENQLYRVGIIRLRTISFLVLHNRTYGLPWEHLRLPPCLGNRHLNADDLRMAVYPSDTSSDIGRREHV